MLKNDDVIVFIGDSISDVKFNKITRHLCAKNSFPLQVKSNFAKRINCKFVFKGIRSNRSYDVYDRLTADCINYNPDYVFLLIGVNDAWQLYVPEQYPPIKRLLQPHFKEILRRFKEELKPTAVVTVLLPFMTSTMPEKKPFENELAKVVNTEIELAKQYGFNCINLQALFDEAEKSQLPKDLSTDSIHPTSLGHSIIAKAVIDVLQTK
ncbi:MAG: GDSL-type esterase/lipase family protein [Clostridia bacterium]